MRAMLMRTCLSDLIAPSVATAARTVLERVGVEVRGPRRQTCCGQPGWSSGHPEQARPVARQAMRAFRGHDPVIVPSGSCAAMIRHGYVDLFSGQPEEAEAKEMADRTIELTQFLAQNNLRPKPRGAGSVTHHDSCHMLRLLDDKESARAVIAGVEGLQLKEMEQTDVCCGFGGTFSVNFPEVSGRLGEEKARNAVAAGADELVACDLSCLLHIAGRARRCGIPLRVRHIAEVLSA